MTPTLIVVTSPTLSCVCTCLPHPRFCEEGYKAGAEKGMKDGLAEGFATGWQQGCKLGEEVYL